jgi:hypothetical protein
MTDPVRPVADSAEWWRQIAQRLAIDAFDLRAALDGLVGDFIKATEHEGATDCKKYPSYPKALLALNNPLAAAPVPCAASPDDKQKPPCCEGKGESYVCGCGCHDAPRTLAYNLQRLIMEWRKWADEMDVAAKGTWVGAPVQRICASELENILNGERATQNLRHLTEARSR